MAGIPDTTGTGNNFFAGSHPAVGGGFPPNSANPSATGTAPEPTPLHAAALAYAAAGIPTFPCLKDGKQPATAHGFKDATTDPAQIDRWWQAGDFNLAVEPERAGWCVIDIDRPEFPTDLDLPPTYTVRTPRGGWHLYYAGSLPPSAGKIAPGIDTRGVGSYVLVPPSVVNGHEYTVVDGMGTAPVPAWIVERMSAPTAAREAPEGVELDTPFAIETALAEIKRRLAAGLPIEGDASDNRTYQLACRLKDYGISQHKSVEMLGQHWAPHFDQDWLAAKVGSAYRNGQNEPGCDRPLTDAEAFGPPPAAGAPADESPMMPLGHRGSALRRMEHPPIRWAWRNRVELGRPMIAPGDKGTGKTTLAVGAAVASLGGVPYLGEPMERMPWLILLGEDTYRRADDMLAALCRDMGVSESVLDDIHVISAVDEAIPGGPTLCKISTKGANSAEVAVEQSRFMVERVIPLLDELRSGGPVGFIIDPLDKFVEFDRNNTYVARAVNDRWLEPLCRGRPGLTPWLNDHPSKAGMKDGFGYGGAPGLVNAIPSFLVLRKKLDAKGKPIVEECMGIRQVSLELEVMRVKEAPEVKIDLYRIGNSPLLSLRPAEGLTLAATMARVIELVEQYRVKGQRVRCDAKSASTHGPSKLAEDLQVDERSVRDAMSALCAVGIYEHRNAATNGKAPRDPGGLMPGEIYGTASEWTVQNLYKVMQYRKPALLSQGNEQTPPWVQVDITMPW